MTTITNKNIVDWHSKLSENHVVWQYPGYGPHPVYTLGDNHSDFYFNSDYLARNPSLLREVCLSLFEAARKKISFAPDWILTYPPFGVSFGLSLAELFQCEFDYIKSLQEPMIDFDLQANETVLLCADDIHTGTSIRKVFNAARNKRAKIIGPIAVVANFTGESNFEGIEIVSLITKKINVWHPDKCPLCASGSRALSARENWLEFIKAEY